MELSTSPPLNEPFEYELEVSTIAFEDVTEHSESSETNQTDDGESSSLSLIAENTVKASTARPLASSRKRFSKIPENTANSSVKPYVLVNKKPRYFTAILGHWDGGSSQSKPRLIMDRSKKAPIPGMIAVVGPDAFSASGGYYDPQNRLHHQTFPNIIKHTVNGIRDDSSLYSCIGMFRWYFVHFEDIEAPDLADWNQWIRYDTMYDSSEALVKYYSGTTNDLTKSWKNMVNYKETKRGRRRKRRFY